MKLSPFKKEMNKVKQSNNKTKTKFIERPKWFPCLLIHFVFSLLLFCPKSHKIGNGYIWPMSIDNNNYNKWLQKYLNLWVLLETPLQSLKLIRCVTTSKQRMALNHWPNSVAIELCRSMPQNWTVKAKLWNRQIFRAQKIITKSFYFFYFSLFFFPTPITFRKYRLITAITLSIFFGLKNKRLCFMSICPFHNRRFSHK